MRANERKKKEAKLAFSFVTSKAEKLTKKREQYNNVQL